MILTLSSALAKRWKFKPVPLSEVPLCHPAFLWRADLFAVGRRRSNIICVNEESLFSFILLDQKQMPFKKTVLNIINRISDCLFNAGVPTHHIRQGVSNLITAKHTDRRVIGTMIDQKFRYGLDICYPHPDIQGLDDIEDRINECPLGMLNMESASKAFAETVKKEWLTTK